MADIQLTVDISSLAEARRRLDGFQKAMNNLSVNRLASGVQSLQSNIRQLVEAQARGTISQNAYQRGLLELKRAYEQLGYSSQRATAAVRAYADQLQRQRAAQEAARAAEELARAQQIAAERTRQLRLRFQEGYATFARARQQMRDLRDALRQGIITSDQYREAIRRLREEQQRAGNGAGDLARRMNRAGVLTQQAGYQIGDFIVQVQSGTNAFVAFGQQATQIAGTLTLLGGKWIGIGSALGIVIPLVTALGAMWMRTSGRGRTLQQTVTGLTDATGRYRESVDNIIDRDLEWTFGNFTDAVRELEGGFVDLNRAAALRNFNATMDRMQAQANAGYFEEAATNINTYLNPFQNFFSEESSEALRTGTNVADIRAFRRLGYDMSRETYVGYTEGLMSLAAQGDIEGVLSQFNEFFEDATDGAEDITQAGYLSMIEYRQALLAVAEMAADMNGTAEAAREAAEAAQALADAEEEAARIAERLAAQRQREQERRDATIASMENELAILEQIHQYGRGSLEVATLRATLAGQAAGFVGEELDRYVRLALAIRDATENAEDLSEVDIASGISSAVDQAGELARRLGVSLGIARMIATGAGTTNVGNEVFDPRSPHYNPNAAAEATRQAELTAIRDYFDNLGNGDSSGGGGGGQGTSLTEIIANRERQISQEIELIRLGEQQARVREIELELIREIGGEADATAMAQIQAAAQTIAAIENQVEVLENLRDVQEGFADTVSESFGDALMSIIDGTKSTEDAFRSMAAAIIRELYDILVVQQLVGSIRDSVSGSGFLSSFLGSMAGRASGGTMNPNQPYLVGERGPEIVMPGRQSTVTNANQTRQAMSQESAPVINMTYNFQGGITEADLARATPMLVERTKAAVVDTVQRGGSMARVFR